MKVGFIGLGIMGLPMATNISKKYDVIGYDVIKKDVPFKWASSYKEVVDFSDVIITMVPKNEHMLSVYTELLKYDVKNKIFIDMSTIAPEVSLNMSLKVKNSGATLIDAPVVKSQPAAIKGELGIYVGGDYDTYKKVEDILLCMGKNIIYMGSNSKGLVMKILHNMLVGEIQNGVNEVMTIAKALDMNIDDVKTAISYGGGQCFYLDTKAENIKNETFPTAFSVENMNKDVHFAKEFATSLSLDLKGLDNVVSVYEKAMDKGLAKEDFSASFKVVKENK